MNTEEKNLTKKNLFRFLTLVGIALIIALCVSSIKIEIEEPNQHVHIPKYTKTKPVEPKEILPIKYKVKYRVTCPGGLDGRIYYTYLSDKYGPASKISEFSLNRYPPKLQTYFEYEFEVEPPFDAKVTYFTNCEDTSISIYIDGDLVEYKKIENGYYVELFWQLVKSSTHNSTVIHDSVSQPTWTYHYTYRKLRSNFN